MSIEDEIFQRLFDQMFDLDPKTYGDLWGLDWVGDEEKILAILINAIEDPHRGDRDKPRRWFWEIRSLPGISYVATIYDSAKRLDVGEYRYIGGVLSMAEGSSPAIALIQAYINALRLFIRATR